MNKPVSPLCGHSVCMSCMKTDIDAQMQRNSQCVCSICSKPFVARELLTNFIVLGMISKIKIKCLNEGCTWEGQHDEKEEHHKRCEFCSIVCPNGCRRKLIRRDLDRHNVHCKYQTLPCQYCSLRVRRFAWEEHEKNCRDRPSPCPLGCGVDFSRLVLKIWIVVVRIEVIGLNTRKFDNVTGGVSFCKVEKGIHGY